MVGLARRHGVRARRLPGAWHHLPGSFQIDSAQALHARVLGMPDVEVAVVGGGPAGLVASVHLARLRHSVAVVDASQSRLATIPRTRNYPGAPDGVPGPA